jgi:hypothetical protein
MRKVILAILSVGILLAESAAGLKWTAPAGWTSQGSAPFRVVTWKVQDAECIVYFFGEGQGGSIEANLDRWQGQFSQKGKVTKRSVNGVAMTAIDLAGTYTEGPHANYRMVATVAEGPKGNLFIRFIGPQKTVTSEMPKYEQLISTFQRE